MVLTLALSTVPTPLGAMLLACDAQGDLHASDFADAHERLLRLLARRHGRVALRATQAPCAAASALARYFAGARGALADVPVALTGTLFQTRVWAALRTIPPGQTRTYGAMAATLGHPNGARAVGQANAANPFNVIIPCHRLTGADGTLTGYAGGLARKRTLLAFEAGLDTFPGTLS